MRCGCGILWYGMAEPKVCELGREEREQVIQQLIEMFRIADTLERAVRYPGNVHIINRAPLNFQFYATAGRPLFMRDPGLCYKLIESIRRMYWDFEPMARQHLREVLT
ncbi:hypothetical protein HRbin15_02187 [bacterium HR15]|nr:hypothetical protein HRbin15_02187 [bacterium HR15]